MRWAAVATHPYTAGARYPTPCELYFTEGWYSHTHAAAECGVVSTYAVSCYYTWISDWELQATVTLEIRTQECR